jgi:ankyrin repeat protein
MEVLRAVRQEDIALIRNWIAAGKHMNCLNEYKWSALMSAAETGNLEMVRILLDAGCDVNARCKNGWTPLTRAIDFNRVDAVRMLLAAGANVKNALGAASWRGYNEIVQLLLDAGADVDQLSMYGTPLMMAANGSRSATVRLLLDRGANVNVNTKEGWTAYHVIVTKGWIAYHPTRAPGAWEIVGMLLAAGVDTAAKDHSGLTALRMAAKENKRDLVRALLPEEAWSRRGALLRMRYGIRRGEPGYDALGYETD